MCLGFSLLLSKHILKNGKLRRKKKVLKGKAYVKWTEEGILENKMKMFCGELIEASITLLCCCELRRA